MAFREDVVPPALQLIFGMDEIVDHSVGPLRIGEEFYGALRRGLEILHALQRVRVVAEPANVETIRLAVNGGLPGTVGVAGLFHRQREVFQKRAELALFVPNFR